MKHHLRIGNLFRSRSVRTGGAFVVLMFAIVASFFLTRGSTRVGAELSYTDTSALASVAGSVVPASCDSNDWRGSYCNTAYNPSVCHANSTASNCPATGLTCEYLTTDPSTGGTIYPHSGDHFTNDCHVACPLGGSYDPYVDPAGTACPGIKVQFLKNCYGTPWGTMPSGMTRRGYQVSSGTSCPYQDRLCTDGVLSGSYTYTSCTKTSTSGGGTSCFVAGTKVTMADGSTKNIETIKAGELVMSPTGPLAVEKAIVLDYSGEVYSFNGDGNYFVTPNHPFMTTEGWKSIDPTITRKEIPGLKVSKLEIGDTFILEGGKTMKLEKLDSTYASTHVYNFQLGGNHEYYADGYLVHNKLAF